MRVWASLVLSAVIYCISQAVTSPLLPSSIGLDQGNLLDAVGVLSLIGLFSSLAYLYIEQLLSRPKIYENLVDAISKKAGEPLQTALDHLTESLIKAAGDGQLRLILRHSEAFASRFLEVGGVDADVAGSGDEQLKILTRRFREGDIDGAIEGLQRIKDRSPEHMDEYLSMLCCSVSPRWIQVAYKLITAHGRPHHYNALAYSEWRNGRLPEAVKLAEQGLRQLVDGDDSDVRAALQNSLAYYYADALAVEHAEKALRLSQRALESRRASGDSTGLSYADASIPTVTSRSSSGGMLAASRKGCNAVRKPLSNSKQSALYQKHTQRGALRLTELRPGRSSDSRSDNRSHHHASASSRSSSQH